MFLRVASVVAMLVALMPARAAAQPASLGAETIPRRDLDLRLNAQLREVIVQGVTLFNPRDKGGKGDQAGCFRLFHGSLLAILPLLESRPELKSKVESELKRVEALPNNAEKSLALRKVIDEIRDTLRRDAQNGSARSPDAAKPPEEAKPAAATPPLWDRLGGDGKVRALVKDFVAATLKNPKVDFTRGDKFPVDADKLEESLVRLLATVAGGPADLKYEGKEIKAAHQGMGITDEQFFAMIVDLLDVLEAQNVPAKERNELVAIVLGTRKEVVEAEQIKPLTLWQRLGGEDAVKKIVHEFVLAAGGDPKVNVTRDGKYKLDDEAVAKLEKLLVAFVSSVTGGPLKYDGRSMKEAHAGMNVTDEEFDAAAKHLVAVLKNNKVPEKEIDELMAKMAQTRKDIVAPKEEDKAKDDEKSKQDQDKQNPPGQNDQRDG